LLLHLVDVSSASGREAVGDYEAINRELHAYDPQLAERPQIVVATKIDALDEPERLDDLRRRAGEDGRDFYAISSVTNTGVRELVFAVSQALDAMREADAERAADAARERADLNAMRDSNAGNGSDNSTAAID
jgi:GTP-binding protein